MTHLVSSLAGFNLPDMVSLAYVSGNETIPANLIKHLQETMKRCTELGLQIPGDLQAQALHFCS